MQYKTSFHREKSEGKTTETREKRHSKSKKLGNRNYLNKSSNTKNRRGKIGREFKLIQKKKREIDQNAIYALPMALRRSAEVLYGWTIVSSMVAPRIA